MSDPRHLPGPDPALPAPSAGHGDRVPPPQPPSAPPPAALGVDGHPGTERIEPTSSGAASPTDGPALPDARALPHDATATAGTQPPQAVGTATGTVVERPHPLTPLVRGWMLLAAVAFWIGRDLVLGEHGDLSQRLREPLILLSALGAVTAAALVLAVAGTVTWLTTRFVADDAELRVETGWVVRRSHRIAYPRIQSVDLVQPFVARLVGLARLSIDVGSEGATTLQFLSRRRASELRDYLMHRAHGHRTTVAESTATTEVGLLDDVGRSDRVLIRVPPHELVVGALLSHELLFIVLGFLLPAGVTVGVSWVVGALGGGAVPQVGLLAGAGLLIPMAMAVASFLSRRVVGQFGYTLAETRAGLRITRGLTSLSSQSVPAPRIQSIRIAQPVLWRLIGRYRIDIEVLGYGLLTSDEDQSGTSTILLPIGSRRMVDTALHAVWPGLRLDAIEFRPTPPRARLLDWFTHGWLAYGLDEQVIVTRTGWLTRLQSIVPHARLQSVRLSQGPLERRLGLANLDVHTTGLLGSHTARHLDADEARRLLLDEADRARTARTAELVSGGTDPATPGDAAPVPAAGAAQRPREGAPCAAPYLDPRPDPDGSP